MEGREHSRQKELQIPCGRKDREVRTYFVLSQLYLLFLCVILSVTLEDNSEFFILILNSIS